MNQISPSEILTRSVFLEKRAQFQNEILKIKKNRRLEVGPFMSFLFENKKTILWQIQEMLRIEKGGDAEVQAEIEAYAPMVPQTGEIVATLLIEIDEAELRKHILGQLSYVDEKVALEIEGDSISAQPTDDHPRTTADGKTSAVHFIKFILNDLQMKKFEDLSQKVLLKVNHPQYQYEKELPQAVRLALIEDLQATLGGKNS